MKESSSTSSQFLKTKSPTYQQCWNYLQSASYELALDKSIHLIQREPQEPDGYIFKARALFHLKRYRESEQALMKVVSLSQSNNRLKSDVNGMIKLKDELANVRVEILRSHSFRDAHDIAQMHWNDSNASIIELIGFSSISSARIDTSLTKDQPTVSMETDCEIIGVKQPTDSVYVYPEVSRIAPKDTGNLNRSAVFPVRDNPVRDVKPRLAMEESLSKSYDIDETDLETAGLKTSLVLAEEKVKKLEEELRRVYTRVLSQNKEMDKLKKTEEQLRQELNRYQTKGVTVTIKKNNARQYPIPGNGVIGSGGGGGGGGGAGGGGGGDIVRGSGGYQNSPPKRVLMRNTGNTGDATLRVRSNVPLNPIAYRVASAGTVQPFRYRSSVNPVNPVTKRLRVLRITRAPQMREQMREQLRQPMRQPLQQPLREQYREPLRAPFLQ